MKIAIFTDTFTPQVNGVARTFQRFVEYLDQNEIQYRLFVPDTKDEDPFTKQIFRFASLPFFLYPECRLALPNVFHIKKELEQFQPDIIHIATPFNMGLTGLYYGKKLNIPIVGSYHTHFDHYLQYYDLQFLSKWLWKYMNWFHSSFQKTFVPSYETKHELIRRGFSDLEIWSRGVNCQIFHPNFSSSRLREEYRITAPYILSFVGRLAPEKDINVLIKIAQQLPSEIKENVHWLIAGDGPLYHELQEQNNENMTFTGYIKGQELAELYAASDLFIFPSKTETFGNVVLEALACGTPAIGARAGGVQEIIRHDHTGHLCEPGNVEDFISRIVELLQNPSKRKQMGYEGRKYALSRSWNAIFHDLLTHYEEVIELDKPQDFVANM
ncbi:glycosyltransferase family 4 protein [Robertmurraya kyonggiensis]|uniref:Glycosyltransferase family 1 protein n=1 Tax=Robertmurraya kyonggiensis TaxID=1037680 RepID=A0A4U1D9L5_9BACI|nr:glycosyltransferase family 1 protein [Robertmurraya kyonggiensis]TKC19192.1 glycosyltransferase family 1 protein [Robertmurraya kyonggiensis]